MILALKKASKIFFIVLGVLFTLFVFSIPIILTEAHGAQPASEVKHAGAAEHQGNGSPGHETVEHAAATNEHGGAHHEVSLDDILKPMIFRFINFFIFVGVLIFVSKKPLRFFLAQRRKQVEEVIQTSAEQKAWAEQMFADYNRRLEGIGKEIDEIKVSLRKEGEFESARIISHSQEVAANLSRDTQMIAQAEIDTFKNDLRKQTIEMAAEVAREAVMRAVNQEDQQRLSEKFVAELEHKSGGPLQ